MFLVWPQAGKKYINIYTYFAGNFWAKRGFWVFSRCIPPTRPTGLQMCPSINKLGVAYRAVTINNKHSMAYGVHGRQLNYQFCFVQFVQLINITIDKYPDWVQRGILLEYYVVYNIIFLLMHKLFIRIHSRNKNKKESRLRLLPQFYIWLLSIDYVNLFFIFTLPSHSFFFLTEEFRLISFF